MNGQACYVISLDHYIKNFTATGGDDLVYVETNYGCYPTCEVSEEWLSLDWWSEEYCVVSCEANSGSARNAYVLFDDKTFYVYQAALTPLTAGTISGTSSLCYNTSPGTLSGTSATGGNCGTNYSYQWQVSTTSPIRGFNNISGATSLDYSAPSQTSTRYYRRKVTCNTLTAYSNVLTITVYDPLNGGEITGDQVIMSGATPSTITSVNGSIV